MTSTVCHCNGTSGNPCRAIHIQLDIGYTELCRSLHLRPFWWEPAMIPFKHGSFLVLSAAGALGASASVAGESCCADDASSTELISCDATQLACMIRRRQVSSQEVVRACIDRIKKVNPAINAVVCDAFAAAEQQAGGCRPGDPGRGV